MIRPVTVFEVSCDGDGCSRDLEVHSDEPHWESREAAEQGMPDANWTIVGDKHYCPQCACTHVGHVEETIGARIYCARCSRVLHDKQVLP